MIETPCPIKVTPFHNYLLIRQFIHESGFAIPTNAKEDIELVYEAFCLWHQLHGVEPLTRAEFERSSRTDGRHFDQAAINLRAVETARNQVVDNSQ